MYEVAVYLNQETSPVAGSRYGWERACGRPGTKLAIDVQYASVSCWQVRRCRVGNRTPFQLR
ncbi:hypothetical protein BDM02DRAFT_1750570 [Thelephora ganbajun]|uniref:Uncharacterized protein n=1 Tax=Thelephora ganbajun TaxID=370292 RepID=A0ACB6ZK44_THEGA|nr:hypothetical protein BDM02DRAFT_1750570 [Thelephora ganbajun]